MPVVDRYVVTSDQPILLSVPDNTSATVMNTGQVTVFYGNSQGVTAATATGQLPPGRSVDLTVPWFGIAPPSAGEFRRSATLLVARGTTTTTTAAVAAAPARSLKAFPGFAIVAGDSHIPDGLSGTGTNLASTSRLRAALTGDLHMVSLFFGGWYMTPSTVPLAELALPNDISVMAAIETVGGRTIPLRVNGATKWTVTAGSLGVATDPIDVDIPESDVYFYMRCYVEVATTAGQWAWQQFTEADWGEGRLDHTSVPADVTSSTGVLAASTEGVRAFGPHAILGTGPLQNLKPMVALAGDSIMTGQQNPAGAPKQFYGYAQLALTAAKIPYLRLSKPTERVMDIAANYTRYARRLSLGSGCTHAWIQYGINDLRNGSQTAVQVANNNLGLARKWSSRGAKVAVQTITPATSGTFTSAASQTPDASNTNRVTYNDWVRDGCPVDSSGSYVVAGTAGAVRTGDSAHPVSTYFDVADTVEVNASNVLTRNGGRWIASGTGDGVHPTDASHTLMSAAVNTKFFLS